MYISIPALLVTSLNLIADSLRLLVLVIILLSFVPFGLPSLYLLAFVSLLSPPMSTTSSLCMLTPHLQTLLISLSHTQTPHLHQFFVMLKVLALRQLGYYLQILLLQQLELVLVWQMKLFVEERVFYETYLVAYYVLFRQGLRRSWCLMALAHLVIGSLGIQQIWVSTVHQLVS